MKSVIASITTITPYKIIVSALGALGSAIAGAYGGWNEAITTVCCFMVIDYVTGLIVAAVFKNSPKTSTGALESLTCFKGLCRKFVILLIIFMAYRIDVALGTNYIRDGVCIAFTVNEAISIIENAGLMGLEIPQQLTNAIDVLKKKSGFDKEE